MSRRMFMSLAGHAEQPRSQAPLPHEKGLSARLDSAAAPNVDLATVDGFGREWTWFDQSALTEDEGQRLFATYFSLFDFANCAEGFDLGCGSGRWARFLAPKVGTLHCIEPSAAIDVARRNLADHGNVTFHCASADDIPLPDGSQSFGCAIGVLHHIPDPEAAMRAAVRKLKPGGQFLAYLYYRFDNRPPWFRLVWRCTDLVRRLICRLPFRAQRIVTGAIAALVYLPLARAARWLEMAGLSVQGFPLSSYRRLSFYTMRTDALDRFATRLERRFTRAEIAAMMGACGLESIRFRDGPPFWVASGIKVGGAR